MFDAAVVMGPLPEGSFFALLAEHGDRIVRDEDFAECYSGRRGICGGRWVKKLIDAVTAVDQGAGGRLVDGLEFDYADPNEKPDARWRERAERERMLTRVAQDAERALEAVEQAEGLLDDERVAAAHGLLRELIGQDFEIDQDGVPRLYRGTRQGRIISIVDPEMRHGRKSSQQRFDGYKLARPRQRTAASR